MLFTLSFFQALLLESRSVLLTTQQVTGSESVKFLVRKHFDLCSNYLKSDFGFMLGSFE